MRFLGTVALLLVLVTAGCGLGDDGILTVDATGTVAGLVFLDRDGDRELDPAVDAPAARVRVTLLLHGSRTVVASTMSGAGGGYLKIGRAHV